MPQQGNLFDLPSFSPDTSEPLRELGTQIQNTGRIDNNVVQGSNSVAIGRGSQIIGTNSVAVGELSTVYGGESVAIGQTSQCIAGQSVVVGWDSNSQGGNDTIIGARASSGKSGSNVAVGYGASTAPGNTSLNVAVGALCVCSGSYAVSIGQGSTASGALSTVVGQGSTGSSSGATIVGQANNVSGTNSIAIGVGNTVTHANNCIIGNGVTSVGANQLVFDTDGSTVPAVTGNGVIIQHDTSDFTFMILTNANSSGNGSDMSFSVKDNVSANFRVGKLGSGTNPALNIIMGTTTYSTLSTAGAWKWQAYGAGTLQTDASGNITAVSDERLKSITGPLTSGLDVIRDLRPILYHWKPESGLDTEMLYAGLSAQNVQRAFPLGVGRDLNGHLTLDLRSLIAVLINAVNELEDEIRDLRSTV